MAPLSTISRTHPHDSSACVLDAGFVRKNKIKFKEAKRLIKKLKISFKELLPQHFLFKSIIFRAFNHWANCKIIFSFLLL